MRLDLPQKATSLRGYISYVTFNSDHLVPSAWVLHGGPSFPDVVFWIVAEHGVRKVPVGEPARDIHLDLQYNPNWDGPKHGIRAIIQIFGNWEGLIISNLPYRGEQLQRDRR